MTTVTILHNAQTTDTITLTSLASDTNLVAGRAGTAVSHEDTEVDSLVSGKVTLGGGPTASKQVEIWAYAALGDPSIYTGGATGSDANLTPQEKTTFKLLTIIPTAAVSNQQYNWGPFSMANAFGGTLPRKTGVYIVHNTGVNLNASGGLQYVTRTPVQYSSA